MVIRSRHLCRHVLMNQHRLMHFLQKQIRLGSSGTVRAQQIVIETGDTKKRIKIDVSAAYETKSRPIEHDPENGHLFKTSDLYVRLATPTQLQTKPDADALAFGKNFTDHMLKIYWHKSLGGWQKPEITPMENLVIHPAAKVLHYAIELFEGMKAYRGIDGRIRIFRPNMNMNRMNLSAKRSGLPTFDGDALIECMKRLVSLDQEWVPHTESASLYLRPTLIGIDPTLGVASSNSALLYTILSPVGGYFANKSSKAVSLLADPRYTRAWPGGVGDRKMGSNYAPTIQVQREAISKGLHQVLWLYGPEHQLTEVGTMNIFVFFINDKGEKELLTPPLNGLILPGIIRDSILTIVRQWDDFKVTESSINMSQIIQLIQDDRLLEMFGAGTACIVCPIERINFVDTNLLIPTMEQETPVYQRILDTLSHIQYGKIKHPWAVPID